MCQVHNQKKSFDDEIFILHNDFIDYLDLRNIKMENYLKGFKTDPIIFKKINHFSSLLNKYFFLK